MFAIKKMSVLTTNFSTAAITFISVLALSSSLFAGQAIKFQSETQLFDLVLAHAQKNRVVEALAILDKLIVRAARVSSTSAKSDLFIMTKARLLFQLGDLDKSEKTYASISKSSEYWLEAQEERAHISGRQGDFAKALAQLQSVMASPFESVVGPEPYFVSALTSLRICDYSAIFKTNENFKKRFVPRLQRMKTLVLSDVLQERTVSELISSLNKNHPLSFENIGPRAKDLPRNMHRDKDLRRLSMKPRTALRDRAIAERIQILAKQEISEIENIVSKLHIVEAEAIQSIYLAESEAGERNAQGSIAGDGDTLIFPKTDETWLDELTHYAVRVEKCPNIKTQGDRVSNNKKRASL